ncbi:RecA protein [Tenacibaculum phage Larrie]|nr:RecA protein [Tenacibaculum phage Larrie]
MGKSLDAAINSINKKYGEKVVQKMSDSNSYDANTISSGRESLNEILGGGYGIGKIIEIYSENQCGKTGLVLEAIREVQLIGGNAAIIDVEHALNKEYCEKVGVDVDSLIISQPTHGEQAFEIMKALINSGEVDLVIVDSVANMTPLGELNGESGESKMGLQARMMSQGLRMITAMTSENDCTVIFINQLREKIGSFVTKKVTTGGNALPFYASQRLELKNKGFIKKGEEITGFKQHIKVIKNKIGSPFKTALYEIDYEEGFDKVSDIIDALVSVGVLIKSGAYFKYKGKNIAHGKEKLLSLLKDDESLFNELSKQLNLILKNNINK